MAKSANQKSKLLVLYRLLMERTDEENPLSTAQIIDYLEQNGIGAERKSIYDDMETLKLMGVDVQSRKGRGAGWFIGERDFELPELKLLVDAGLVHARKEGCAVIYSINMEIWPSIQSLLKALCSSSKQKGD